MKKKKREIKFQHLLGLILCLLCFACQSKAPATISPVYPPALPPKAPVKKNLSDGSLFTENVDLYADGRAHKVGNILTVLIEEKGTIEQDGTVDLSKESEVETSVEPTKLGDLTKYLPFIANQLSQLKGSRKNSHKGESKYEKSSNIKESLAVVVTEVRSDGLLVVWGKRHIVLDGETKTLAMTGLVNPDDVRSDNTIYSTRIALSSIHIEGRGTLTATTEPGLASKTFRWLLDTFWPF